MNGRVDGRNLAHWAGEITGMLPEGKMGGGSSHVTSGQCGIRTRAKTQVNSGQ